MSDNPLQNPIFFDTSPPLFGWYFMKLIDGEKDIEMRTQQHGIEEGDKVRFMNGYNPKNGAVVRKVEKIERVNPEDLTDEQINRLGLENKNRRKTTQTVRIYFYST